MTTKSIYAATALLLLTFFRCGISADIASPTQLNERGKVAFQNKDYQNAFDLYSAAIAIDAQPGFFRNRGRASIKLNHFASAESDYKKALTYDAKDSKALYWLGNIAFRNSVFAKSIYYLRRIDNINSNPQARDLLINALLHFEQRESAWFAATEAFPLLIHDDFKNNLRKLGIAHADRVEALCGASLSVTRIQKFLRYHMEEKNFMPLELFEYPKGLVQLLGKGSRVATVFKPTLQLRLSKNFEHVDVYNASEEEIQFHNTLLSSITIDSLDSFLFGVKQKFSEYILQNSKKQHFGLPASKDINQMFDLFYGGVKNLKIKSNITVQQEDICAAINNEAPSQKHDVVFLSGLPSRIPREWLAYYGHIRHWLEQGKTVVYTLLHGSLACDGMLQEFTEGFKDVARAEFVGFEESPLLVYVKLTPQNTEHF